MLQSKDLVLRDFKESDIEKRMFWETVETEWQLWDAPWEFAGLTGTEKKKHLQSYERMMREWLVNAAPADEMRKSFQIDTLGTDTRYIGWVAAYYLNENDVYTKIRTDRCAVGIDIPDVSARGKGYAYQALGLFIEYLYAHGEKEICLQTWSGNERMVHIAENMGFEECGRKKELRTVRGKKYDALTFRLNREKFAAFRAGECENCRSV